jgi:hypothetical protein
MNWPATIANTLWVASSLPTALSFRRSLEQPDLVQERLLMKLVADSTDCAYGRKHHFSRIRSYEDFASSVPVVQYSDLEPWIERIQSGEGRILTSEPVTNLVPTSGSTGARKLIPFTRGLHHEFNQAIAPWIADLVRCRPGMLFGPAYWSISPASRPSEENLSGVHIGFADDADYLGGKLGRLVRAALVSPRRFEQGCDLETFRFETLFALLQAGDLRFISVWHPSFLTLLLDALPGHWDKLLSEIACTDPDRAQSLRRCDPHTPTAIWPKLCAVSCWGDGLAEIPMNELRARLPKVLIQPKGLLATEACITIPLEQHHPVAVQSHFFEFIDEGGRFRPLQELQMNDSFEVVVTTAGGLWRYRLGDRVRVDGYVGKTPSLRFLCRVGNVSDLFGEKLSEVFVACVIDELAAQELNAPKFAMLAPLRTSEGWCYRLYLEGKASANANDRLESLLLRNPHYGICRQLGQLGPAKISHVESRGYERFFARLVSAGMNLGDIKPSSLSTLDSWEKVFR